MTSIFRSPTSTLEAPLLLARVLSLELMGGEEASGGVLRDIAGGRHGGHSAMGEASPRGECTTL